MSPNYHIEEVGNILESHKRFYAHGRGHANQRYYAAIKKKKQFKTRHVGDFVMIGILKAWKFCKHFKLCYYFPTYFLNVILSLHPFSF